MNLRPVIGFAEGADRKRRLKGCHVWIIRPSSVGGGKVYWCEDIAWAKRCARLQAMKPLPGFVWALRGPQQDWYEKYPRDNY